MEFYRVEHQTIMSGLVVRYKLLNSTDFEINASRDGVMVQGHSPSMDVREIGELKLLMTRAVEISQTIQQARKNGHVQYPSWFDFAKDPLCVTELHKAHFAGEDEILERRERQVG